MSDPSGFTFRPSSRADVPALHALQRRCEVHDGDPYVTPLDEVEDTFDIPGFDPARDSQVVVDAGGRVVGWARVQHFPADHREEKAYLWGMVDPAHRRKGIGNSLFRHQLARATELLSAADHGLPCFVRTSSWDWLGEVTALYTRHGLRAVRFTFDMLRPLDRPIPDAAVPEEVIVARWDGERSESARLAHLEAFADHWGSVPATPEWWEHKLTAPGVRLDLSLQALAGADLAGYCLSAVYPEDFGLLGRREGWVETLGVRKAWQRRGIASALLAAALRAFRDEGLTHAALAVDSENASGALGLYERLGFEVVRRSVTHQLEIER